MSFVCKLQSASPSNGKEPKLKCFTSIPDISDNITGVRRNTLEHLMFSSEITPSVGLSKWLDSPDRTYTFGKEVFTPANDQMTGMVTSSHFYLLGSPRGGMHDLIPFDPFRDGDERRKGSCLFESDTM